ncbi:hypothetical protein C8R43DRAFT_124926 [Mycena crocata]|nr:hypothetical protein C8R43DRAFT_124926 [Mycena crocata]
MSHHYSSASANTMYATSPSPWNYDQDDAKTPRASDFLPGSYSVHDHASKGRLPADGVAMRWHWKQQSNTNRPAQSFEDDQEDDATSGRTVRCDTGPVHQFLNVNAPEFRPSSRPASSVSSRSSATRSSTFSRTSSSGSVTSVSRASTPSSHKSNARGAQPSTAATGLVPQYPQLIPGEEVFNTYRERLRYATDQSIPISTLLEVRGIGNYERTQFIALLAHRLSAYAPCGSAEFRVLLRAEALKLMAMYWQAPEGSSKATEVRGRYESLNTPRAGLDIAAFMGSLFRQKMISVHDVHHCLSMLISAGPSVLKLRAAHAILVHGGARICAPEVSREFDRAWTRFAARAPNGTFIWGPDTESQHLLSDVHETMDRYIASSQMQKIHAGAAGFSAPSATARRV